MLTLRKSRDRGYADHAWLKSCHSFLSADDYDAASMGWGALRLVASPDGAQGSVFLHAMRRYR